MPRKKQETNPPQETKAPTAKNENQQAFLLDALFGELPHGEAAVLISTQHRGEDGVPLMWREAAAVIPISEPQQGEEWVDDLVTRVTAISTHNDIYFCVTPRLADDSAVSNIRRADHTHSLTSLWADFDKETSSAGKKVDRAWSSYEEIAGFMFAHGVPEPTIVIDSGNGWHLYWLLDEPVPWGEDGRAEKLLNRWGAYLMGLAAQDGKHLDHVFDPSRVLRLPGTMNWKGGWTDPRPVTLIGGSKWKRYGYIELDELLPEFAEGSLPSSELGDYSYLGAQEVGDFLKSLSAIPVSAQGETLAADAEEALRKSDQGGRHASAYTVLAKVIQQHKFNADVLGIVENLGSVWKEVKPDAERHEWRNLVTHVTSRRAAEHKLKAESVVEVEAIPKMTVAEEHNSQVGLPQEHEWGRPVVGTARENRDQSKIPTFPTAVLPQVMQDIVRGVAKDVQADESIPAIAALGCAAAATAGGFIVSLNSTWEETMALYLIGVADPSERKTPSLKPFHDSVVRAARNQIESTRDERVQYEARGKMLEARVKETLKTVGTDEQAHLTALAELDIHVTATDISHLVKPSIIFSDITQESLVVAMAAQNGVSWVSSSEGAFIGNLAGRYSQGKGTVDMSAINEAYSGSVIRSSRITRGDSVVENPHLVITVLIQPSVANLLSKPEFQSTGFLSRLLFADPRSNVGHRHTKIGKTPGEDAKLLGATNAWDDIVDRIFRSGWGKQREPRKLTLTAEAKILFSEFWAESESRSPGSAWWGKSHGHLARIAGVLAIVENPVGMQIEDRHVAAGIEIIRYFAEGNASLIRDVVEGTAESSEDEWKEEKRLLGMVVTRVKSGKVTDTRVTGRDLQRWWHLGSDEVEVAAARLVEKGWLAEVEAARANRREWALHPELVEYYDLAGNGNKHPKTVTNPCDSSVTVVTVSEAPQKTVTTVTSKMEVSQDDVTVLSQARSGISETVTTVTGSKETVGDSIDVGFKRERERDIYAGTSRALEGSTPTPLTTPIPEPCDSCDSLGVEGKDGAPVADEAGEGKATVRAILDESVDDELASPQMQKSLSVWQEKIGSSDCEKCKGFMRNGRCITCGAEAKGEK